MQISLRQLQGRFDLGYALDKHSRFSLPIGANEYGHMQFDTIRTDAGEALFQLKYRGDHSQALELAKALAIHILPLLPNFDLLAPMPASKQRAMQPVTLVAKELGALIGKPVFELLSKAPGGTRLKDLHSREDKDKALVGVISLNRLIADDGKWSVLLIDDLYDSGASIDAACDVLRSYEKIGNIFVAALTWR